MKIPSAQELFNADKANVEPALELDPLQALKLRVATRRDQEGGHHCRLGSDSIGKALSLIEHGITTSLTEAYEGQLSTEVLARLMEAGGLKPAIAETA